MNQSVTTFERICDECGRSYTAKYARSRFCCTDHRKANKQRFRAEYEGNKRVAERVTAPTMVRTRTRCGFCGLVDFLPHKCDEVIKERKLAREQAAARRKPRQELHVLYRFFDSSNHLLYVGITNNLWYRISAHSKVQPWWSEVASATMEHYPDREVLAEAERTAIRLEHPRCNKVHAIKRASASI